MPPQKVSKSTATEHASSSKSTATEHAGSTSGAKDPRLETMFQEACAIRALAQNKKNMMRQHDESSQK